MLEKFIWLINIVEVKDHYFNKLENIKERIMTKEKWEVDQVHSRLGFTVRHMMISNIKGVFKDFHALIIADPEDLTDAEIEFSINANSINTHREERDKHLRSEDFFDVKNHPKLKFKATDIKKVKKDRYDLTGEFTIIGITKLVTFEIEFQGRVKDQMTNEDVAGFTGHTKINRGDFGLNWNSAIETGGVLVSDEVRINIDIQIRKSVESKLILK